MAQKKTPFLTSFINDMNKRFAPTNNPRLPGNRPAFSRGSLVSPDGGVKGFTGAGADNVVQSKEPAGIVHEGEMVIPANDVRAAGGPDRVRTSVDQQIGKTKIFPTQQNNVSALPGFERGGIAKLPGYETGTGSGVVGDPDLTVDNPAGNVETRDPDLTSHTEVDPHAVTQSNTSAVDNIDLTDSERSEDFTKLQDDSITELKKIESGQGTAAQVTGDIARSKLAGSLAAGTQAAAQAAAQQGLTGGALSASRARQQRENSLAQTGLEGQLALDAVNRAENATLQLANMAEKGLQFEEMKRQFGANFDMAKANFGLEVEKFNEFKEQFNDQFMLNVDQFNLSVDQANEARLQFKDTMDHAWDKLSTNIEQFNSTIGLQMFQSDLKRNQWAADTLMLAGDFEGAQKIYSDNLGIDVDFSNLQEKQDQENFGNAIANLDADIELLDGQDIFDGTDFNEAGINSSATDSLIRAWNAMHPDQLVDKNSVNSNDAFKTWAKNTFDARTAMSSPYHPMISSFTDDELGGLILGITDIDENGNQKPRYTLEDGRYVNGEGEEFSYAGKTGVEAMEMAYSNLLHTRALTANPDGSWTPDEDNPALQAFGLGTKGGDVDDQLSAAEGTAERLKIVRDSFNSGDITFGEINPDDIIYSIENDPSFITTLKDKGVFDDAYATKEDFASSVGKRKSYPNTNWVDPGQDNTYEASFVENQDDTGDTVWVNGQLYEARGMEMSLSGTVKYFGYPLDSDGNRTSDSVESFA